MTIETAPPQPHTDPLPEDGGACGALLRAKDWDASPLGPIGGWPPELRTVVGIALGSKQPMLIVWGPEQIILYNDGYAAMCGDRHPAALGGRFRDLWFDIWDQIEPIISAAYQGISTSMDDIEFVMHRNGYPEETHFAFSYSPVRDPAGAVLGMFCACVETTGQVILQRRLAKEREQMRGVFEMALGAVAIVDGPDHVFTFANSEYQQLVGHRDLVGSSVAAALPEVVDQGFVELLDTVRATGEAYIGRNVEIELRSSPDRPGEKRMLDFNYHPIPGPDGRPDGIFVQVIDVTERASAEQQQQLVNRELAHRMKNQLALIQAVAFLTLRSAPDLVAARTSLGNRIAVLAQAQDMLLSGEAGARTVGAIVSRVARLFDGDEARHFRIDGPELQIGDRAALSLALLLHELSTNAAKYGALSVEQGVVTIGWRVETRNDLPILVLEWEEQGGPPLVTQGAPGSGTKLFRAGISGTSFSQIDMAFRPSGAHCVIKADLKGIQA
jgi:PAS domain S-box-containing protein